MTYVQYGVKLSQGQKQRLAKAISNRSAITLRLSKTDLSGSDMLMLTNTQLKRIQKAMNMRTGVDLKISKTQIGSLVKHGGSLWSSLLNLGMKALPFASKAASKLVPGLASGAMHALGSMGIDKIFGSRQQGGFLIPQNKINELIQYKDLLTKKQKEQIVNALHTNGQLIVKPTIKQSGGFLGTLLASIGVPLLMNALTGRGLQVDSKQSKRSANVFLPKAPPKQTKGASILPMIEYRTPPFHGTWDNPSGSGIRSVKKKANKKKDSRQRSALRKKQSIQQHPSPRSHILKFINKPLSNFDIKQWVKQLGIKHFRGIYSRDTLPNQILNNEVGIINLDTRLGPGTHWVAYRNGKNRAEIL